MIPENPNYDEAKAVVMALPALNWFKIKLRGGGENFNGDRFSPELLASTARKIDDQVQEGDFWAVKRASADCSVVLGVVKHALVDDDGELAVEIQLVEGMRAEIEPNMSCALNVMSARFYEADGRCCDFELRDISLVSARPQN